MKQRRRRLAQLGTDVDLLDSKLSSLERMGQFAVIKVDDVDAGGSFRIRKILTARTLNSEVLPAFCNPIMVMSISVALDGIACQQERHVIVAGEFAFSWAEAEQLGEYQMAHQAARWALGSVEKDR